jgi:hypothetical protein
MSAFFNYLSTIFPSYVPQYGNFPQYTIWSNSFLMYFMILLTTGALVMVTIMDKDGKSAPTKSNGSSGPKSNSGPGLSIPLVPLPSAPPAPLGPKIPTSGGKKRKTYKYK